MLRYEKAIGADFVDEGEDGLLDAIIGALEKLPEAKPHSRDYHLPGEHDQCDHSVTGECVEEEPQGERAPLFKGERDIVSKPVEHVLLFDANGRRKYALGDNNPNKVTIPEDVIEYSRVSGALTLTHNHPNGASFSIQDILTARQMNLAELRVVGKSSLGKFTYILKRPENGWPKKEKIWEAYLKYRGTIQDALVPRYKSGLISKTVAEAAFSHALSKLTAKELGLDYRMIRVRSRA